MIEPGVFEHFTHRLVSWCVFCKRVFARQLHTWQRELELFGSEAVFSHGLNSRSFLKIEELKMQGERGGSVRRARDFIPSSCSEIPLGTSVDLAAFIWSCCWCRCVLNFFSFKSWIMMRNMGWSELLVKWYMFRNTFQGHGLSSWDFESRIVMFK